jgi:hypothetical protein
VWDWVVANVANAGIAILNTFITLGGEIQNFFIGIINWILEQYNALADSVVGDVMGLDTAELIPEVDIEANLIPPREVPTIDVDAAFRTPEITGGLESEIAAQEEAVAAAREEDETRRREAAASEAAAETSRTPTVPDVSSLRGGGGGVAPPSLPEGMSLPGAGAGAAAGGPVTVNLGGVTVNVNAERLEANAAQMLSDEIVRALADRLGALLAEQNFRTGTRPS